MGNKGENNALKLVDYRKAGPNVVKTVEWGCHVSVELSPAEAAALAGPATVSVAALTTAVYALGRPEVTAWWDQLATPHPLLPSQERMRQVYAEE